jgi:hypothetical protein
VARRPIAFRRLLKSPAGRPGKVSTDTETLSPARLARGKGPNDGKTKPFVMDENDSPSFGPYTCMLKVAAAATSLVHPALPTAAVAPTRSRAR